MWLTDLIRLSFPRSTRNRTCPLTLSVSHSFPTWHSQADQKLQFCNRKICPSLKRGKGQRRALPTAQERGLRRPTWEAPCWPQSVTGGGEPHLLTPGARSEHCRGWMWGNYSESMSSLSAWVLLFHFLLGRNLQIILMSQTNWLLVPSKLTTTFLSRNQSSYIKLWQKLYWCRQLN